MTKSTKPKWLLPVLGYGALAGLVLICFMVLRYSTVALSWEAELYAGTAGLIFLVLGLWLGYRRQRPNRKPSAPKDPLSPREMDILEAVSQGASNREVADTFHISLSTVKTHLSNIYAKLGVKRRTQAISTAKALKILS
ncbi:MAG: response regulator transcription factor [Pseudomonadota bacterium]